MTHHPCFQLQLYVVSAAMVHRRRLRRRHYRRPFATYFMYIYHLISIDLQSSRSCNSTTLQSLHLILTNERTQMNTSKYTAPPNPQSNRPRSMRSLAINYRVLSSSLDYNP